MILIGENYENGRWAENGSPAKFGIYSDEGGGQAQMVVIYEGTKYAGFLSGKPIAVAAELREADEVKFKYDENADEFSVSAANVKCLNAGTVVLKPTTPTLEPTSTARLRLLGLNHRFLYVGFVNGRGRAPCRPRILFVGDHQSGRDAVINTIVTALSGGNYVNNVVMNPTTEVTSSLLQMFIDPDEDAESDMSAFFVNTPPWPRTNTSKLVDIIVKGHLRPMDADEFNNPADVPSAPFQKSQHIIVLCVRASDRKKQEVVSKYVDLVATAGRAGIATVVLETFMDKEDPRVLQQPSLLLNAHDPKLTEMRKDLSRALGVPIHRVHPWVSYGVGVRFPNGDVDEHVNKHALTVLRSVYADVDGYFRQLNGGVRTHPSLEIFKGNPAAVKCHFCGLQYADTRFDNKYCCKPHQLRDRK